MTDHDLELFVTDARAHLDRTLAAVAAPDLAASVARAREIDPGAVPAQAVSDASALAPVVQLRPSRGPTQVRPMVYNNSINSAKVPTKLSSFKKRPFRSGFNILFSLV